MSLRRSLVAGGCFVVLVLMPRAASAEMWDMLFELSGPQMHGFVTHCKIAVGKSPCYNLTVFAAPLRPTREEGLADALDQHPPVRCAKRV